MSRKLLSKKLLLLSIGLVLILTVVIVAAVGDKFEPIPIPDKQEIQVPSSRASCFMYYNLNAGLYHNAYSAGDQTISYFDPTNPANSGCGITAVYSFEITNFYFSLYGDGNDIWPVNVDVVVYDLDPSGDPCAGPGAELCRYSILVDNGPFTYPAWGPFTFPTPCCVNGPFFIGLEYTSGAIGTTPSMVWNDVGGNPSCLHYYYDINGGLWYEWNDLWNSQAGHPLFAVAGETEAGNCDPDSPKNWYQEPDLTELGIGVNATPPLFVIADDFLCTKTEPISEIHIWGSWLNDVYPGNDLPNGSNIGDAGDINFIISLRADVPAGVLAPWSMPGEMLAQWHFEPFDFIYNEVELFGNHEGWMWPPDNWQAVGDHNCWEYVFQFDQSDWFTQEGSVNEPIVYWLEVQAHESGATFGMIGAFGWKTSTDHWNDNAVWYAGENQPGQLDWNELIYPEGHPYAQESIDLAFQIRGSCDCEPGEADGNPLITILDVVYIINYKYKDGPDPLPYALCSADADGNCTVSILDVVYIINYKYKNGPHPITCGNFIANCPGGLR